MKLLTKERRNQMKMQKSVIFVKKILKRNILKIKNIVKLEIIVIMQGKMEGLRISNVNQSIVYL